MDVVSGIDRHPDRTGIYFGLQIQGNRKLNSCFHTFYRSLWPYLHLFFHLVVNVVDFLLSASATHSLCRVAADNSSHFG